MNGIFRFLGLLSSIYSILVIVRLLTSWVQQDHKNSATLFLARFCDPYLDFFKRLAFFKKTNIDFSPIFALSILSFFTRFFYELDISRSFNIFPFIGLFILSLWFGISFVLGFFFIIFLLRLFSWKTAKDSYLPLWHKVSLISEPAENLINKYIFKNQQFDYGKTLITGAFLSLGLNILGSLCIGLINFLLGGA